MLSLLLFCALGQSPSGAEQFELKGFDSVVMMPLSGFGSTEEALTATQNILVREVRGILGDGLLEVSGLRSKGQSLKRALDECDGAIDCLLEIFGALGHDGLIVGTMSGLGSERAITLKLYNLKEGKEFRQSSEKASGEKEELIRQIRKAAVRLLDPQRFVGHLKVLSTQPGVQILIDGQLAATTPLAEERIPLSVGTHSVEARRDGLVPFEAMIDVAYEEVKELTIDLPRNNLYVGGKTPYYARWWTWVIAGVGLGAAGGGTGLYFDYAQKQQNYGNNALNNFAPQAEELSQNENRRVASIALIGAGSALVATTLGLLIADAVNNAKVKNQRSED